MIHRFEFGKRSLVEVSGTMPTSARTAVSSLKLWAREASRSSAAATRTGVDQEAGLSWEARTLSLNARYSYGFRGNSQTLDQILVGGRMRRSTTSSTSTWSSSTKRATTIRR